MYSTRVRAALSGTGEVTNVSIEDRKAVRVLPLPVGAQMSVCWPPVMAGQPCTWAGVGAGNDVANQARTAGEKRASTS